MANVSTVEEVLADIACTIDDDGKKKLNRFNRKNFDKLLTAAASDPNFTANVAQIKKKEFTGYEEIAVGSAFRKWVRSLLEKAGIDSSESAVVENADFPIGNMSWMYDMFAEVLWLYMNAGNKFDLPKKEGFEATLSLKDVEKTITESESRQPGGESLGVYETTKETHQVLTVKSKCPAYLTSRRKVRD